MVKKDRIDSLPKIDLHCHLDGSITLSCLESLLGRKVEKEEVQVSSDCQNLAEYLEKFDLPLSCLQTEEGLRSAGRDFLLSLKEDNIKYAEVRFAPLLSVNDRLNCKRVIESVLEGLEQARNLCGIDYGVIVCAMRHHSEGDNLAMFRAAREYLSCGVCGGDLAGNEAAYPMENFKNLFAEVKRLQMPFTIHAGECGRAENIRQAILCGARRIGHGIAMRQNPQIKSLCRDKRIGIEMCPISNGQTRAVSDMSLYPMKEFLEEGLLVTLNTDNRTVSNTSIQKEMRFLMESQGISEQDLRQMTKNAVEAAFAKDEIKAKLLRSIEES